MPLVSRHTCVFDAPIEAVWEVISDHCGMHRWLVPGMRVRLDPPGEVTPNGVGAVRVIERGGYAGREEVVRFEPPHRLSYRVLTGFPIDNHLGEIVLDGQGPKTQLCWTVTFDARYPGTGWLLKGIVDRVLGQGLARIHGLL